MKVGIIYGGTSSEKEPSKQNALAIMEALERRGYATAFINYDSGMTASLQAEKVDIVFLCVQGKGHGDGTLQGVLDYLHIPYTGSRLLAASIINDKIQSKILFEHYGHKTAEWTTLSREEFRSGKLDFSEGCPCAGNRVPGKQLPAGGCDSKVVRYPFVAKAPSQGGSFGLALVRGPQELERMEDPFQFDDPILIERFIKGTFYTIGVIEKDGVATALPCAEGLDKRPVKEEITLMSKEYDAVRADIDAETEAMMARTALDIFRETGAHDYVRIDFMLEKATNTPYVLEINAVPGLKPHSLLPHAALYAGIEYDDLIEGILLNAARREGLCSKI